MLGQERGDRPARTLAHRILRLASRAQGTRAQLQRVVATLDPVNRRWGLHLSPNTVERVERAERVTRPLHEQDGDAEREQDLGAEIAACATQRVAEADDGVRKLLQRDVAALVRSWPSRDYRTCNGSALAFPDRQERAKESVVAIQFVNTPSRLASMSGATVTQGSGGIPGPEEATWSHMPSLPDVLRTLEDMRESDPEHFKEVMSNAAIQLRAQANGSGDGLLGALASRFDEVGDTGDLSLVQPPLGVATEPSRVARAYGSNGFQPLSSEVVAQVLQKAMADVAGGDSRAIGGIVLGID